MIDVYSDSVGDEEYLNIDVLVDKIVLHSDVYEDNNSYGEMSICFDSFASDSFHTLSYILDDVFHLNFLL